MPWTYIDAKRKNHSLSDKEAHKWAEIANAILRNDSKDKISKSELEAKAIKIANYQIKEMRKKSTTETSEAVQRKVTRNLVDETDSKLSNAYQIENQREFKKYFDWGEFQSIRIPDKIKSNLIDVGLNPRYFISVRAF